MQNHYMLVKMDKHLYVHFKMDKCGFIVFNVNNKCN